MKTKILFSIIFLTFLISYISAVSFSIQYSGSTDVSKTITLGESANVRVFGSSMYPPVSINVKLNSNSIYSETLSQNFEKIYTINPLSTGAYTIEITATDGIESKTKTLSLTVNPVPDTTAPVITLTGSNPQVIIQGNAYTELGATASDNQDGDLTSRITRTINVNTNVIGTYSVIYFVLDNAGNSATATRTVNVVDPASVPDTTAPVITLTGSSTVTIQLGSSYTDAGATATDDRDGTITPVLISNNVNHTAEGIYYVTYRATDLAGNFATATRTVIVDDTTAPLVEITSPTNKTYYKKELALKLKIENADNCWYKLNDEANVSFSCSLSKFDILVKAGQNTLTVYANDSAGNLNSDSVTFRYTKKTNSNGGSSGNTITVVKPIVDVEPSGSVVIPITQNNNKEDYTILYIFMIATTSIGIVILSIILIRKLREIKASKKPVNQNKIQEQPYY